MKILVIASILPVPEIYPENDAIFRLYDHYRKAYPDDQIEIWRPSAYSNAVLAKFSSKWESFYKVLQKGQYDYYGFRVKTLPFLDKKASPYTLSILSKSLWYFNKGFIKREIHISAPDLIHAHWLHPDGWLANKIAREYKIPFVLTLRRETEFFSDQRTKGEARQIVEDASSVTVLNIRMKRQLEKLNLSSSPLLIPHGIEDFFFKYFATPDRKREGGPSVLTISRFLDWKYLDRLLKALGMLKEEGYQFTYTLYGRGPEEEHLKDLIQQLGLNKNVFLHAPVSYEEVPFILEKHDIFALTSYPETFGRVYFEAMAVGLPVICSQNSGVDGFFDNGEAGYFVDHNVIEDIAEALRKLLKATEQRARMGKRGKEIVNSYTWPNIAEKFNYIYQNA